MEHPIVSRAQTKWSSSYLLQVAPDKPILAYRVWALTSEGWLAGYYRGTPWRPGVTEHTRCSPHREPLSHSCHCGLWGYPSWRDAAQLERRRRVSPTPRATPPAIQTPFAAAHTCVVGVVALWGHVRVLDPGGGKYQEVHGRGFESYSFPNPYRGEFGRVAGVCTPAADNAWAEADRRLAELVAGTYRVPLLVDAH